MFLNSYLITNWFLNLNYWSVPNANKRGLDVSFSIEHPHGKFYHQDVLIIMPSRSLLLLDSFKY